MFRLRKLSALLMGALLLFSLASCGQNGNTPAQDVQGIQNEPSSSNTANPSSGDGLYYSAVHTIVPVDSQIDAACVQDGVFYYIADSFLDSGRYAYNQLVCFDTKTGKTKVVEQFDVQRDALCAEKGSFGITVNTIAAGADGILVMAAQCVVPLEEAATPGAEPLPEDNLPPAADGSDESIPTITYPILLAVQPDGTILWASKLTEDTADFLTQELIRDAAGYTYLRSLYNDLIVIDPEGTQVLSLESCCNHLATLADGRVVLLRTTPAKDAWTALLPDLTSGQLQTLGSFPISLSNGGYYALFLPGTEEYDLYCAGNLSLYGLKLGENEKPVEAETLLTWLNCDMDGTNLIALETDKSGGFLALTNDLTQDPEAISLQAQSIDPNQGKVTLTMACRNLPSSVSAAVRKFNRQSAEYRIEIKDYGAAAIGGVDRLTTDLNAGNVPDLFCTDGIDLQPLISGGWLENLWSYIDADAVLSRDSLVMPLFEAMSFQGGLYAVTGGFTLKTTLALSAVVGDEPGWSIAEMQQAASSLPDLELISHRYTRELVVDDIVQFYAQSFMDMEAGTASFDSPEFVELLEYALQYPTEVPATEDSWMLQGRQLFRRIELYSLESSRRWQARLTAGAEGSVWKGYPGIKGSGCVFCPETPIAMSAGGKHKEAAWAFLRSILLPENQGYNAAWSVQMEQYESTPSNREVFDAMIRDMCSPPEVPTYLENSDGLSIEITGWSQQEADAFYALIDNTVTLQQPEGSVSEILRDEMQRFFAGQQDARATASAIQNRVQLYLAELG